MNAQHITYYNDNNEDFADVYIEDNLIFTCRVAGLENTGGTVILLHGWPETSKMWSKLLPFLSSKNYRVIAPDQRGYSKGARPLKVKDYSAHKLAQDIINIANSFEAKKFHLVGHDWGSGIGWYLSSFNKNRISKEPFKIEETEEYSLKRDCINRLMILLEFENNKENIIKYVSRLSQLLKLDLSFNGQIFQINGEVFQKNEIEEKLLVSCNG